MGVCSGCATTACSSGYRCPGDGTEVQCTGHTTPNAAHTACVACTTPASGQMWADPSIGCSTVACATGTAPTNGTSRALVSGVCTATCNRGYINDYGQCIFSAYSLFTETYNSRLTGTGLGTAFQTTRKECAISCYNNASCAGFVMDWTNASATGNDNPGFCTLFSAGYGSSSSTQRAAYTPVACLTGYTGLKCDRCANNYRWNGTSACVACRAHRHRLVSQHLEVQTIVTVPRVLDGMEHQRVSRVASLVRQMAGPRMVRQEHAHVRSTLYGTAHLHVLLVRTVAQRQAGALHLVPPGNALATQKPLV